MREIKRHLLCLCIGALLCAESRAASAPGFTIFENGSYQVDVVVPEKMGGVEKYAVEELVYHFGKAFGKKPDVVGEDGFDPARHPFHIYIGATKAAAANGLPVGKLADEEHCIKTVGNGLYLLGGDGDTTYDEVDKIWSVALRGTLYAVYDFLENEMDVKWLWPGPTGEVVPKRDAFRIGGISRRGVEPLEERFYFWFYGRNKVKIGFTSDSAAEAFLRAQDKLQIRQRHGTRISFRTGHAFGHWWEKYHEKHPEYFNLLPNGKRMPHRAPSICTMCVSEPGVRRQLVEEWRSWWEKESKMRHARLPWVNCCENDAAALCTCERCRSWDGPDPRFEKCPYWNGSLAADFDEKWLGKKFTFGLSAGGRWTITKEPPSDEFAASLSDRYVHFYNNVAAEAKKYNPEAKAIGYAYVNYIEPPLKTHVGPDTVIIFVPRSYFPYDEEESATFRRQWGGWAKMGATRMVYRPNYMLAGGNHPIDMSRRILDDFAFAYTNGMFACQQDSITGAWSAQAMHLYAMTRAMRDPLRGYEKARADMLSGFGKAADAVNRYFDKVEAHSAKWTSESYRQMGLKNITGAMHDVGGSFRNPNAILGDFFDDRFIPDCYAILDEAVRDAQDDAEVVARVEFLRKGLRDTELGRNCRIAQKASDADPGNEEKKAAYRTAFKALVDYRASVEGDFVCNYSHHADWERSYVGWPHKIREAKPKTAKPSVWGE